MQKELSSAQFAVLETITIFCFLHCFEIYIPSIWPFSGKWTFFAWFPSELFSMTCMTKFHREEEAKCHLSHKPYVKKIFHSIPRESNNSMGVTDDHICSNNHNHNIRIKRIGFTIKYIQREKTKNWRLLYLLTLYFTIQLYPEKLPNLLFKQLFHTATCEPLFKLTILASTICNCHI